MKDFQKWLSKLALVALFAISLATAASASTIQTTVDPHREGEDSGGYFTTTTGIKTPALFIGPSGSETQVFLGGTSTCVNITAAGALTQAANSGVCNTVNSAAGIALTLPAATGSGASYTLYIMTTVTSVGTTITTASGDYLFGSAYQTGATGAATNFLASGTKHIITLNGTTTGGIKGDLVKMKDTGVNQWSVEIEESITGTAATPFS